MPTNIPYYCDLGSINSCSPLIRDWLLSRSLPLMDSIANNGAMIYALHSFDTIGGAQVEIDQVPTISQQGQNPWGIDKSNTELKRDELINYSLYTSAAGQTNDDAVDMNDLIAAGSIGYLPTGTHPLSYPKTGVDLNDTNKLETEANEHRAEMYRKNKYLYNILEVYNTNDRAAGDVADQTTGYLDANRHLNVGGPSTSSANIIGSIMSGGLGFSQNGLEPNFDLRSTLMGRVLTAANVINDTPLGRIGAQQMALALMNNVGFNLQQETIGHVNTNPLSLLQGNNIIVPNYHITTPDSQVGQVFDFAAKLMGFQVPVSILGDGSIEYGRIGNTTARNNDLISHTGRGQINNLFAGLQINHYRPAYKDSKKPGEGLNGYGYFNDPNDSNETIVSFQSPFFDTSSSNVVDHVNDPRSDAMNYDENRRNDQQSYAYWPDLGEDVSPLNSETLQYSNIYSNPDSILYKTFDLFQRNKIGTLINSKGRAVDKEEIQTGVKMVGNSYYMSKGNAVTNENGSFCRSWTSLERYNRVKDLVRHRGLDKVSSVQRYHTNSSVLDDNGFPRISPYYGDDKFGNMKRFMFSIENLAWADNFAELPESEQGPGDRLSSLRGRIMWFPPYDISFSDSTSVNWESTQFIGRAEPVYTYSNTERSGTLQFKIIADHPSVMNDLRWTNDKSDFDRFLAGCTETMPNKVKMRLTPNELAALEVQNVTKEEIKNYKSNFHETIDVYFPNGTYTLDGISSYESSGGTGFASNGETPYNSAVIITYPTTHSYNDKWNLFKLNSSVRLTEMLKQTNNSLVINLKSYATSVGVGINNTALSIDRGKSIKNFLVAGLESLGVKNANLRVKIDVNEVIKITGGDSPAEIASDNQIVNRKVSISFRDDPNFDSTMTPDVIDKTGIRDLTMNLTSNPKFVNEAEYFFKLQDINRFAFEDIRQKLRWFHPAFHSTTPEGLNARLTFLQQCGRQGSTGNASKNPDNLAFGRPPVCILRIGDFYHTKIVIENINFNYEPLLWDLNPEGVGVQPMLVTVDLSFKFIGGSSLEGPINRLQNAVSFNFFANNEIYSQRPDYIENGELKEGYRPSKKNMDINNVNSLTIFDNPPDLMNKIVVNQIATSEQAAVTLDERIPRSEVNIRATIDFQPNGDILCGLNSSTSDSGKLPKGHYFFNIDSVSYSESPYAANKVINFNHTRIGDIRTDGGDGRDSDVDNATVNTNISVINQVLIDGVYMIGVDFFPDSEEYTLDGTHFTVTVSGGYGNGFGILKTTLTQY